jgi:hypothetical protein
MTQFKEGYVANRETGMSLDLRRRFVIVRGQENDWDEPCKSRGLRTVLWAAGGEIPPADPARVLLYPYQFVYPCEAS